MRRGELIRILAAAAVSVSAHVIAGAVLVDALRPAPVDRQAFPETSLDLIGYEAPRGEIIEKDTGGDPARQADANGTQVSEAAIRRESARTTPPPVTVAALRKLASARAETAARSEPLARPVDPAASAASELDAGGATLTALGPGSSEPVAADVAPEPQALSAMAAAGIPLRQSDPEDVPIPASLSVPDDLAAMAPMEVVAGTSSPASRRVTPEAPGADRFAAMAPDFPELDATPASGLSVSVSEPFAEDADMRAPPASATLAGGALPTDLTRVSTPETVTLATSAPSGPIVSAGTGVGRSAPAAPPPAVAAPLRAPAEAEVAESQAPHEAGIASPAPSGPMVAAGRPASLDVRGGPLPAIGATAAVPDAPVIAAGLAWSGTGEDGIDPVSLAAIQSFVTGSDLRDAGEGTVRDGIAELLAEVPCSRLQVAFDPGTGALDLRGHVPEEGLRGVVAAALRAQVGGSIPVMDRLQILPRPQCGALAGIAAAGLPQSTDQETDPRLIGEDSHTVIYRFTKGDRMIFDVRAPDYDAWVYVDYFDAAGMVVHLVPNETVSPERHAAKSEVSIGADRADGNFLAVTIGPPYGQEIAVAFAASVPLHGAVRPTVESAAVYLDWLKGRVRQVRAAHPDFKGEWVYFLVASSER